MVEETTVYCGTCGGTLSATARFCRACGASQEDFTEEQPPGFAAAPPVSSPRPLQPEPPPSPRPAVPSPGAWPRANAAAHSDTTGNRPAAYLAVAGGLGMCFMVLYVLVYVPLHHHFPVAFGESLQFGDLLAFGAGVLAVVLGVLALRRAPTNPGRTGAVLMLAGGASLILVLVWALPETLQLDYFQQPFYFGFVYFCELGRAHIGDGYENGYVQVPLLVSSAGVFVAGCLMAFAHRRRASVPTWQ
jgi:hypothetical protein